MDSFVNPKEYLEAEERRLREEMEKRKRFPESPEKDVLQFLIEHAPLERWQRDVWPALRRRARRERRTLAFVDEAGFYLLPGLVKTYAPEALTPVVYEWQTRDHL